MHDLNLSTTPTTCPAYRRFYRKFFPASPARAARIVTVSGFSKQDIMDRYGVPAEPSMWCTTAWALVFGPATDEEKVAARRKLTNGHPYVICVGSLHLRRTSPGICRPSTGVAAGGPDLRLVIVGEDFWGTNG